MKWQEALQAAHEQHSNIIGNADASLVGDIRDETDFLLIPQPAPGVDAEAIPVNKRGVDLLASEFELPPSGWQVKHL